MTDPTDIDDLTIDGADLMAQILASLEPDDDNDTQTITTRPGHAVGQRWAPTAPAVPPIVSQPKRIGLSSVQLAMIGLVFASGIVLGIFIGMGR